MTLRKKVVVVEDSEPVRKSLNLLLRTRGYQVASYSHAKDALAATYKSLPDCYLIDFKMPDMDGMELLAELRRAGYSAPAIMVTGVITADLKTRALAAGFHSIVEKPPRRLALMDEVADAIASSMPPPAAA
ncbi:MAG: response regulator [Hyphomonadaceae bacterium]|nr:response regulator [Hyphomonadaceae bacterium]